MTRRQMLRRFANGFGMLGLAGLLADDWFSSALAAGAPAAGPLVVKPPQYSARAKRIIFLFMSGGPSHVDTFDPKPRLAADNGKPLPFAKPKLERTKTGNLLHRPGPFRQHGQCGTAVSELFPHISTCVDDMCVIRSIVADNINHNGACLQMNTGEQAFSRPSLGSWLLYGLGSENQDLPGFVVISPAQPAQGAPAVEFQLFAGVLSRHARFGFEPSDRKSQQSPADLRAATPATGRAQATQRHSPAAARGRQPPERAHRIV